MQQHRRLRWFGRSFMALAVVAILAACGSQRAAIPPTVAPTQAPTPIPATPKPAATATLPPPTATSVPPTATAAPTATSAPTLEPTVIVEPPQASPTASAGANALGLPIAEDAVDLTSDPESGDIDYSSPSDVKTLAEFYRTQLAAAGWQEDESGAMVSDAIGSLDFTKGDATLSLAILNVGGDSKVAITTAGLQTATATPEATDGTALTAEDKDGLPVPADYTTYVSDSGPYRSGLTAVSPSALKAVLALYRTELVARKWSELPATVASTDAKAALMFQNPDLGKLELNLTQNADSGTDISLVIKSEAAAKAAGVLPPPGKARIYFGNVNDAAVTFNIDGKDIKVAVGNPSDSSMKNVPFIDLASGKHDFTLTMAGAAPVKDTITLGADETWALLAGPGGALPLQMY